MGELLNTLKKYLGNGRWIWVVGGVVLIIAIAIPGSLLWQSVQPKPKPAYQPVPSAASTASQSAAPEILPAVSKDVIEQVASELGVDDLTTLSVSYQGDTDHVTVTQVVAAASFKRYAFVKGEDGIWSKQ